MKVIDKKYPKLGASVVLDEGKEFYILEDTDPESGNKYISWGRKSDYEPVPEVAWRDVTGRLEEGKDGGHQVFHDPHVWGYVLSVAANSPYRLRKICVNDSEDSVFHEIKTAFIVERKEPA